MYAGNELGPDALRKRCAMSLNTGAINFDHLAHQSADNCDGSFSRCGKDFPGKAAATFIGLVCSLPVNESRSTLYHPGFW